MQNRHNKLPMQTLFQNLFQNLLASLGLASPEVWVWPATTGFVTFSFKGAQATYQNKHLDRSAHVTDEISKQLCSRSLNYRMVCCKEPKSSLVFICYVYKGE